MGFADGYLNKQASTNRLIHTDPDPDLKIIIAVPCYNESGLLRSLDSLFLCDAVGIKTEVIILVNASESSSETIHSQNIDTFQSLIQWIGEHPHPFIHFFALLDNNLKEREAGVGLARKIVMDEAISRFNDINQPDGIILSLDADSVVKPDYLRNIFNHFRDNPSAEGCSIYFEHPLEGDAFNEAVYQAISQYELHLRYYVNAIRFTGYPYAYHTVGSCFGVKASAYSRYGGMNKRQGGEDFYFIQKVAQNGRYSDCTTTCIIPSPRPSDRVPFGTGTVVLSLISGSPESLLTYNPAGFEMLEGLFRTIKKYSGSIDFSEFKKHGIPADLTSQIIKNSFKGHPDIQKYRLLLEFLSQTGLEDALKEIILNTATPAAFMKRFWSYFNMFRILKFLHFIREKGIHDIPVGQAAYEMLSRLEKSYSEELTVGELLLIYRMLDRLPATYHPQ